MLDLLLQITLDTETLLFSIQGTNTDDGHWQGRIAGVSDITREVPVNGGPFQIQSGRISLNDPEGDLAKSIENTPWENRAVTVTLVDPESGETQDILTGRIFEPSIGVGVVEIDVRDDSLDRFQEFIPLRVTPDIFSNVPTTTPQRLIPIVLGNVDSSEFSKDGHIPAYLIDPAVGGSEYVYVCAQHTLIDVTAVYRFGELLDTSLYTVDEETYSTPLGNRTMTVLKFSTDQRERGSSPETEITYDAQGLGDGASPEALITNPATQLEEFLKLSGLVLAAEFDSTLVTAAEAAYTNEGIVGGAVVVDETDTYGIVIDRFCQSFNLMFFRTGAGKFGMAFDNAATGTSVESFFDSRDIVQGSFEVVTPEDKASSLLCKYACDFARDRFTSQREHNDSTEETNLGRDIKQETELWYIREINDADQIAQIKLHQVRQARRLATISVPAFLGLDLSEYVEVTHFAGPSSDGEGFQDKSFRVYGITIQAEDDGLLLFQLTLLDHPGFSTSAPGLTEPARQDVDIIPRFEGEIINAVWTPVDHNTLSWNEHNIRLAGQVYTISTANTGNMLAATYIYWDPEVSTTAYQTTTDPADVGPQARLICLAVPVTSGDLVSFRPEGGFINVDGSNRANTVSNADIPLGSINADRIVANSITADQIEAGTITATEITVSSLASLSANLGAITSGSITIDSSGFIRGGMTDYNTGTGFWLGYNGAAYKFSIGNASGDILYWDGSDLVVEGGTFTAGTIQTSDTGERVVINGTGDNIEFYDSTNTLVTVLDVDADTGVMRMDFQNNQEIRFYSYDATNVGLAGFGTSTTHVMDIQVFSRNASSGTATLRLGAVYEWTGSGFAVNDQAIVITADFSASGGSIEVNSQIKFNSDWAFNGETPSATESGWTTFTNLNVDRTLDADSTSEGELADVLGTLIEALKEKGVLAA